MRILNFWYRQAVNFFLILWKNTMSFIEEDMSVNLMIRLMFVPLFHDSSFVGKLMSIFFRLFRVILGCLGYVLATFLILFMAVFWFLAPVGIVVTLVYFKFLFWFFAFFLFAGLIIFIKDLVDNRPKKVWHIHDTNQIWQATRVKQSVNWTSLLEEVEVATFLTELETTPNKFVNFQNALSETVLQKCLTLAQKNEAAEITPAYFFVAMLSDAQKKDQQLEVLGLTYPDFEAALTFFEQKRRNRRMVMIWDDDFAVHHLKGTNRGWLGAPTPSLNNVSVDLTKQASIEGFPEFVGRQAIVSQVLNILASETDRNVLLVGEPGSGRTALVHDLARRIIAGDAPDQLATKRIIQLDLTKLISGADNEGELAAKVKEAFEDVAYSPDMILFVDEIQNLGLGQAATNYNLYSLLLPYLESSKIQFIASTDPDNYARIIEKQGSFARIFHRVDLPPASVEETMQIMENHAIDLSKYKKIATSYLAIKELVSLANRLIHDRVLPDSALGLMAEAETMAQNGKLTTTEIKAVFSQHINVPIVEVDNTQKQLLLNMEGIIHQLMVDQEEAVKVVSDTLRRASTSLREQNRPIGSFLFVGPTGVGKTELAKTLAKTYFKNSAAFVPFDMSEYQTSQAVAQLIGDENNPGELTEAVKRKPYALILLDEFEKANPQILTLFLQVLEEGRLTDFSGKHVDFSNTIIIATSNAASLLIADGLESGQTVEQLTQPVKDELEKVYRPELLNRFDEVVIFKPLSAADLEKIVRLKLGILQNQLVEQGFQVEFSDDVVAELTKKGFDPVLGARPMRRLIQDTIEANLSKLILENKLVKGESFVCDESHCMYPPASI